MTCKVATVTGAQVGGQVVTDGADGNAGVDWHDNLPRAARAFLEQYERLLAG